jgi:single-stranded DNA-binding protein
MNHTILSGRPVADPDTGTSQNGKPYACFRLAQDRRNGSQEDQREALFINCAAFDGLAESIVGRYVRKDLKLTVAGRLEPDNYDGDDTKYRSFTLVVDDVVLPDRQRSQTHPESEEAPAL